MPSHKPSVTSAHVKQHREIQRIDTKIREHLKSTEPTARRDIDVLLERRHSLTMKLGEMINPADTATSAEWGTLGFG
jgi:hypothetical protein